MGINVQTVTNVCKALTVAAAFVIAGIPASASAAPAATDAQVREAQTIMRKFGLPSGPVSSQGKVSAQTRRGFCVFRSIAGLPVSRNNLDGATLQKLRVFNKSYKNLRAVPAPLLAKKSTYIVVDKTCQTMTYVFNKHYKHVMAASTGNPKLPGGKAKETPSGMFTLRGAYVGWHCNKQAVDPSCPAHPGLGDFASTEENPDGRGNVYNHRYISTATSKITALHGYGSTSVPTYPSSYGTIRISVADSDWMYHHAGNDLPEEPYIKIAGAYKW